MRGLGFEVDDDNDPVPENIPNPGEDTPNGEQSWGWNGICYRKSQNISNVQPKLKHGIENIPSCPTQQTICKLFYTLFPIRFLENTILKNTNMNLAQDADEITLVELLRFIGIWFFLATTAGFPRKDFFSKFPVNAMHGAPYRVNHWMSRRRFDTILQTLAFCEPNPPPYKDKFWQVRALIKAWNDNMTVVCESGWITCLDESMSRWLNRWTCPGWMFVPRKPKPFGNEYHSICCGTSGIVFAIQLCEGKDRPKELPSPPRNKKTTQLLLDLYQSLYSSGKIVVLDSGFSVLIALIALRALGVFACAVANKRKYWPLYVPGDEIDQRMEDKPVGSTDALKGVVNNIPYNIFVMKEPDYAMKLMGTYGGLTTLSDEPDVTRVVDGQKKTFKYTTNFLTILNTATWSTTTTTFDTQPLLWKKHGKHIGGRIECLHFCWPSLKSTCICT